MSTIKSSAENLTLNADGANNDIKFQSNGSEVASIDQAGSLVLSGNLTSLGIDDNATSTAITIDASENVGIGITSPIHKLHVSGTTSRFHRSHSTTTAALAVLDVHVESTGAMADGFGPQIRFVSEDTAGVENIAATLNVRRDGADTAAAFVFNAGASETVRMPSSGGITFNGDTAAANALDDYEEGTWTPTASGGASSNSGIYTKIGNLVHCQGTLTFATQTNSGGVQVESLPFVHSGFAFGSTGSIRYTTYSTGNLLITGNANAATFGLYKQGDSTATQNVNWTQVSGKRLDFDITYRTA